MPYLLSSQAGHRERRLLFCVSMRNARGADKLNLLACMPRFRLLGQGAAVAIAITAWVEPPHPAASGVHSGISRHDTGPHAAKPVAKSRAFYSCQVGLHCAAKAGRRTTRFADPWQVASQPGIALRTVHGHVQLL